MNQIETGYKPEFALGALYQGQNAADAQAQNDQELIMKFLANQHAIENNPILEAKNRASLVSDQWGAKRDQAKMDDPSFIAQLLAGEKGQQQSTEAAGKLAMAILQHKIDLANAQAPGDVAGAKLNSLLAGFNLNAAQPPEQQPSPDANIPEGFSMPNGGTSSGRAAFFPAQPIGSIKTEAAMKASMGNDYAGETPLPGYFDQIDKAITAAKNPNVLAALQAERKDMESKRGQPVTSTPAPVFSNMSAPTQLASNTDRERVMGVAIDTPEYRQKVALAKQAQDAAAAKSAANSAALLAIAEARARAQQGKEPTTAEAAKTRLILNDPNLDPATRDALLNEIMNSKFGMGKNATGQQFGITMNGNQVAPGMQQTVPPISGTVGAKPKPPEGMTMEKLKAQYPPGTPEDKLRAAYKAKYGVTLQ